MPNELRLRRNFLSGTISDNPLAAAATTINSPGFASLPVIDTTNHIMLSLDPGGTAGAAEIVMVTAHTASSTAVTVVRGQEGTTARQHNANVRWVHATLASDITTLETSIAGKLGTTAKAADSDLLDGLDSSGFMRSPEVAGASQVGSRTTTNLSGNAKGLNQYLSSGWYDGSSLTGAPTGDWYLVEVIAHAYNSQWQRQIAYSMTHEQGQMTVYMRRCNGTDPNVAGNWSAWRRQDDAPVRNYASCHNGGNTFTPTANQDILYACTGGDADDGTADIYHDGTGLTARRAGVYSITGNMTFQTQDGNMRSVMINVAGNWVAAQRSAYQHIMNLAATCLVGAGQTVRLYVQVPSGTVGSGFYLWPGMFAARIG